MKNYHLLAAVALIAMAGCSQNEITDVSPDANPVVGFDIYTGGQTKGLITNTDGNGVTATGIQTTGFGILAYYTGQDAWASKIGSTTPNFMWNQKVTYGEAWTYTPVKYWPNTKDDKVSFFAYAPYSTNGTSDKGIKLSVNDATAKPTIEFQLSDAAEDMVDLVAGFQKDKEKQTAAVGFDLKHLLSRVEFKAKLGADISGGETRVFITGMRILGSNAYGSDGDAAGGNSSSKFYEKATYDWSAGVWDYDATPTAKAGVYAIDENVLDLTDQTSEVAGYTKEAILVAQNADKTTLFKSDQYLFLIPPADAPDADLPTAGGITANTDVRVMVDYDIVTTDANLEDGFSKTSTKATVSLNNGTLKRGKAYEYLLTIGLTEVKVSAEVTAWDSDIEETIPSANVSEATLAAIKTAIAAMNTAKGSNPNCNYFVVNIDAACDKNAAGTLGLSDATVGYFASGDKIELNFKVTSTTGDVTAPTGWKATEALTSSTGKVTLTKD